MQKVLGFILSLIFISSIHAREDALIRNDLLNGFSELLSKTKRSVQDYGKYIKDLKSTTEEVIGKLVSAAELNKLKTKLNNQIITGLSNVLTKKISKIQTMTSQEKTKNSIKEWFGVAVYENDAVYYIVVKGTSNGVIQAIEEVKYKRHKKCKRMLWKKKCAKWDEPYVEKRNLNDKEMMVVTKALASKSLDSIRTEFFNLREQIDKEVYEYAEKEREKGGVKPTPGKSETIYSNEKKIMLLQNLKRLVDKKSKAIPSGYNSLIKNIQTNTYINMETFGFNEIKSTCQKYQLPKDVQSILESVAQSSKPVIKQPVNYESRKNSAYLEEIIGLAVKENQRIFFAYIRSVSTGEIPFRWDHVHRKKCISIIFFKKCFSYNEPVAKPITQEEKQVIQNALSAINAKFMGGKIETMKVTQILISKTQKIYSPNNQWSAVISDDGLIYVGRTPDPVKNKKFTIGSPSPKANGPYSLQVKENGSLYILNRNNDATWSSGTGYKGEAPYKLVLDNEGNLYLVDSLEKVIYTGKK